MTRKRVAEIINIARESGWKAVVGGPEPGADVQEYLNAGADVVVIGEGEVTMEELLPALREKSRTQLEKVQGIAFLNEHGRVCQTTPRPQISDIDMQPWPARELVDIGRYVQTWRDA